MTTTRVSSLALLLSLAAPPMARAEVPPGGASLRCSLPAHAPPQAAPRPMADPEPQPIAPAPRTRFARAGTMEAGASLGFTSAEEATGGNLTPSFGWFVADGFQLSGLVGLHYVQSDGQSTTITSALFEPSYHLPFGRTTFGFFGLGLGGSYIQEAGPGFALAPRVGAKIVVGRSGVLAPSLVYQYTTSDTARSEDDMLVVTSALSANLGYSLMW